jgi:stage II sporulation protein D
MMKNIGMYILAWSTIFLWIFLGAGRVGAESYPEVRVLIYQGKPDIVVSSTSGLLAKIDKKSYSMPAQQILTFIPSGKMISWEERQLLASSFTLIPSGKGYLTVNNRPYRGSFLIKYESSKLNLINILPLDDYIKGTIKLEISPHWPEQAVKAQIVTARTYAVKNLGRHCESGYDFCSSSHCQAYGGVNAEDPITNKLVDATRGLILTYQNQPAGVCFHSESGGRTDSAFNVWGKDVPYLISVDSPWESDSPHASWEITMSSAEIGKALQQAGYIQGEIVKLQANPNNHGERVKEFIIQTNLKQFRIPASRFREAIGYDRLPSTFFEVISTSRPVSSQPSFYSTPAPPPIIKMTESDSASKVPDYRAMLDRDWNLDDIITFLKMREEERKRISSSSLNADDFSSTPVEITEETEEPSLKENNFVHAEYDQIYIFRGRGYGHGVGLSQWGARGMAREGYSFQDILLYYFPGCELKKARFK